MDEAQRGYENVLRGDAKNTDALLGLATIAARQEKMERAQAFYQYALESDPNNATAQAGVINTKGQTDPEMSGSRLKSLSPTSRTLPLCTWPWATFMRTRNVERSAAILLPCLLDRAGQRRFHLQPGRQSGSSAPRQTGCPVLPDGPNRRRNAILFF